MPRYRVLTTILDRIEHSAGFKDDGSPKRVVEHKKGDVIDFEPEAHDNGTVDRLLDLKAIEVAKPQRPQADEEKGGGSPPPGPQGS